MTSWNQPPGGEWRPLGSIRLAQEALGGGFPLVADHRVQVGLLQGTRSVTCGSSGPDPCHGGRE